MPAFTIFLTFVLLLTLLAAGTWTAMLLRKRLAVLEHEQRNNVLSAIDGSHRLERQIEGLTMRIEAAERRAEDAILRPAQSINYTHRSQMLRMIRRGDSADQISSALGVPVSQVRLLMKLPGVRVSPESARKVQQSAG
jgi:hypothetical protein